MRNHHRARTDFEHRKERVSKLRAQGLAWSVIAARLGMRKTTVFKVIRSKAKEST